MAEARVLSGDALALIGDVRDGLAEWAHSVDPARAVLDLQDGRRIPTVGQLRQAFDVTPPIVIGNRPERVMRALGLSVQPFYLEAAPLSRRPEDAILLLEVAMSERAMRPVQVSELGYRGEVLRQYRWRGLGEIRHAARHLAALVVEGPWPAPRRGSA